MQNVFHLAWINFQIFTYMCSHKSFYLYEYFWFRTFENCRTQTKQRSGNSYPSHQLIFKFWFSCVHKFLNCYLYSTSDSEHLKSVRIGQNSDSKCLFARVNKFLSFYFHVFLWSLNFYLYKYSCFRTILKRRPLSPSILEHLKSVGPRQNSDAKILFPSLYKIWSFSLHEYFCFRTFEKRRTQTKQRSRKSYPSHQLSFKFLFSCVHKFLNFYLYEYFWFRTFEKRQNRQNSDSKCLFARVNKVLSLYLYENFWFRTFQKRQTQTEERCKTSFISPQ